MTPLVSARAAVMAILMLPTAAAADVTITVASVHAYWPDYAERPEHINPGLIYTASNGFTAGAYRNSVGRVSALLGYERPIAENWRWFVGAASGYPRNIVTSTGIVPMIGVSYQWRDFQVAAFPLGALLSFRYEGSE